MEQARQETGVASGFRATLTVGGRIGLWEELLARWLPIFSGLAPDVAVRAIVGFEEDLMQSLIEGRADIGVMYAPQARPGLRIEPILEERLVMVSTQRDPGREPGRDYIYVDWGPEFFAQHSLAFPGFSGAALTVNVGWLGLLQLLRAGGIRLLPGAPAARARSVGPVASRAACARVSPDGVPVLPSQAGLGNTRSRARDDPARGRRSRLTSLHDFVSRESMS